MDHTVPFDFDIHDPNSPARSQFCKIQVRAKGQFMKVITVTLYRPVSSRVVL
jgi:hypothetical protein